MMATAVSVSDPRVQAALKVDDEGRLLVAVKGGGGGGGGGPAPDLAGYVKKTEFNDLVNQSTLTQVTANQGHALRKALGYESSQTGLEELTNVPVAAIQGDASKNTLPISLHSNNTSIANPGQLDLVTRQWVESQTGSSLNRQAVAQITGAYGSGLVVNGTAGLGNNFNFSKFTFDPTEAFSGFGSFRVTGTNNDVDLDMPVPVNLAAEYEITAAIKTLTSNQFYIYLRCLDIDGKTILPHNNPLTTVRMTRVSGTEVEIHPDDRQAFKTFLDGTNRTTNHVLLMGNYTSDSGFVYPRGLYSQNLLSNFFQPTNANYNEGTGRWAGLVNVRDFSPNTYVGVGRSGGTYAYPVPGAVGNGTPLEWTSFSTRVNMREVARPGTAMVKMGFLLNRGAGTHTTWVSAVQLRQVERSGVEKSYRVPVNVLPDGMASVNLQCDCFGQHIRYTLTFPSQVSMPNGTANASGTIPQTYRGQGNGNVTIPLPGGSLLSTDISGKFVLYGTGRAVPAGTVVSTLIIPGDWRKAGNPTGWTVL